MVYVMWNRKKAIPQRQVFLIMIQSRCTEKKIPRNIHFLVNENRLTMPECIKRMDFVAFIKPQMVQSSTPI